jgi:hypothetical protein
VVPAIEERERLIEQVIAEMAKSHVPIVDPTDDGEPVDITSWIPVFLKYAATLLIGAGIGIWSAGGIPIGGDVVPSDCLSEAHAADRVTQIAVLRELAEQPFDGTTDDGRRKAGEWFNAQRFRNRADDLGPFTDAVAEAIAANSEADLAKKLEGK